MAKNLLYELIRRAVDTQATKQPKAKPVVMSGTTATYGGGIRKDTSLNTYGRSGNDAKTPTQEIMQVGGAHIDQSFANSHLNEGPTPGRIPRPYNARNAAKEGKDITGTPSGDVGLLLGISGVSAGGMGDAAFIPHTSIVRPGGRSSASLRTIDDGAQIPGVFVADATRR